MVLIVKINERRTSINEGIQIRTLLTVYAPASALVMFILFFFGGVLDPLPFLSWLLLKAFLLQAHLVIINNIYVDFMVPSESIDCSTRLLNVT